MKIQKFSLLDTPSSCSIIFFPRCNLDCPYCYNIKLYNDVHEADDYSLDECKKFIESKIRLNPRGEKFHEVSYIAFSGGECTLHENFQELLVFAKELGFKTAVYTNGTQHLMIQEQLIKRRIDFINIDYKWDILHYSYQKMNFIGNVMTTIKKAKCWLGDGLEHLRINTTLMKDHHTLNVLMKMRDFLYRQDFWEHDQPEIVPRAHADNRPCLWTLESFFNDHGKIPTLGNVNNQEVEIEEIKELCQKLNQ